MGVIRSVALGCGYYLPEKILTNDDLAAVVDTSSDWIVQRTGIRSRHIAAEDETTSQLGTKAALSALADANLEPDSIDLIIVATSTPDYTFPATAVQIQHNLGMQSGAAFDMQAVCSGFVFALSTADSYICAGKARKVLVIGAETFSRLLDWDDRATCVLFGDGAGAVVLGAMTGKGSPCDRGILTTHIRSDGRHREKLYVDGGPSTTGTTGHLRMRGRDVFKHAVGMITDVVYDAFDATGLNAKDLDWFIPHQANERIIDASAKKLGVDVNKIVKTIDKHGNTSAASIPLALCDAVRDGRVKQGDTLMFEAMGGGFTWGSALMNW